ncbi:hypothetical protein [Trichlorobacter lovleyi]|uniref:hypothetical protein n=1 Tax=Trichlorobacter lovleyi TaxID=313985 RepID=UPI003D10766F
METHEVLKTAIGKPTDAVIKALRVSKSTVYKWTEPIEDINDSGAINPLDRVEAIIATALSFGRPTEQAFGPIQYLATRFNGVFIPSVPQHTSKNEIFRQTFETSKSFSDLLNSIGASTAPDSESGEKLSPNEHKQIRVHGMKAIQQIAELLALLENEAV